MFPCYTFSRLRKKKMKRTLLGLLIIALLAFLFSCNQPEADLTGDITVIFNNSTRAVDSSISMETASYEISFSGPNGEKETSTVGKDTTSVSKKGLAAGTWTITVNAINSGSYPIGRGTATVEVKAGKTTTANITVKEVEGDGILSVTINGDNPNNSTYTLNVFKNDNGTDSLVKTQQFSSVNDVLKAEVVLTNGYYIIQITSSTTSEQCPIPEAVRIVYGHTTSASYTISQGEGAVSISVNNLIAASPELNLSFSSTSPHVGDDIKVTATGMSSSDFKYEWYVDNTKVTGETSSITLSNLDLTGDYTVSCIVRDTKSSLVWSVTKVLTVYDESYKPQTITVNGDVEFYLVGDVVIPLDTYAIIKKTANGEEINRAWHFIKTFSEATEIYCELTGAEGYSYYFEEKYLSDKNRTLIYVVIDKELESFGYLHVTAENNMGEYLDPYEQMYRGNMIGDDYYIPVMLYGNDRTIKIACGTYSLSGLMGSNTPFLYPKFNQSKITVTEGQTTELGYAVNHSIYSISSSEFEEGDNYDVELTYNGAIIRRISQFTVSDGKLVIPVSCSLQYDTIVIFSSEKDKYLKITEIAAAGETKEYSSIGDLEYEKKTTTIPAGRIKITCKSDGLPPRDIDYVFYRLTDSSDKILAKGSLSISETTLNLSSDAQISIADPLNLGFSSEVTTTAKTDDSGAYTLVELKFKETTEDFGTLIVNYSIPEGVELSSSNTGFTDFTLKETGVRYAIYMSSAESMSFTVPAGTYTRNGYRNVTDTSGKSYVPTVNCDNFTVKKGESTTITVTLVEQQN